ncbi:hypothetical protein ACOMHN_031540 [Nucella lapillus]
MHKWTRGESSARQARGSAVIAWRLPPPPAAAASSVVYDRVRRVLTHWAGVQGGSSWSSLPIVLSLLGRCRKLRFRDDQSVSLGGRAANHAPGETMRALKRGVGPSVMGPQRPLQEAGLTVIGELRQCVHPWYQLPNEPVNDSRSL